MKKVFNYKMSDNIRKMAEEIQAERDVRYLSHAIDYSIKETHNAIFLDYRRIKANQQPRKLYTPEERVVAEQERKDLEAQAKITIQAQKAERLCTELDGQKIENADGSFTCRYTLYEKLGQRVIKGERDVHFANLDDIHVAKQYQGGTKEEIQEILNK